MSAVRDAIGWRARLESAERAALVDELGAVVLDLYRGVPADAVLDGVSRVLTEYGELAAVPDRIRPDDVISLRDFEGGDGDE
ncbi:hypothetical protein [Streptomyces spectabilis]|uniref:Uncharacterized protein n=1 Tax=Streptomyces spectabilis TaxID=68270 RepID=A0A5P2X7U2_STRST|nr:hypothetical protein [Streptomyces spectabilis]MBB5108392.1 hypothetical protein [Streptomyces spectabilis]MCI3901146.1 hypothetical protein [Streptomyces spectabilis]QEV58636.1 hypothetical protein CP982_07800 [Streptomyces spectabilis]GGV46247.1 hypothetical protein GCM10010245_72550 [Streptomyces spectabilis]